MSEAPGGLLFRTTLHFALVTDIPLFPTFLSFRLAVGPSYIKIQTTHRPLGSRNSTPIA
jgi:hypothetical protein